jgi:hypothetical protein
MQNVEIANVVPRHLILQMTNWRLHLHISTTVQMVAYQGVVQITDLLQMKQIEISLACSKL